MWALGQQGGNEKPSLPKRLEGLRGFLNSSSSLAVFYVEQVALNRHVSPQPRLFPLCSKSKGMSRTNPETWVSCRVADQPPRTQTLLSDNASVDPQIAAVLAPNRARAQCPGALPRCAPTLFV